MAMANREGALEKQYVHDVYESTAHHFKDAKYKAWPKVKQFLDDLEPGSMVADVGCGHGKYLGIKDDTFILGCDYSAGLLTIARDRGHDVTVADNLHLPYRDNCCDAVVSIGVIHHLTTQERRAHAINELARILRPGGKIMIYVWAMEQTKRVFKSQDVLIPWHLKQRTKQGRRRFQRTGSNSSITSDDDIFDEPIKTKLIRSMKMENITAPFCENADDTSTEQTSDSPSCTDSTCDQMLLGGYRDIGEYIKDEQDSPIREIYDAQIVFDLDKKSSHECDLTKAHAKGVVVKTPLKKRFSLPDFIKSTISEVFGLSDKEKDTKTEENGTNAERKLSENEENNDKVCYEDLLKEIMKDPHEILRRKRRLLEHSKSVSEIIFDVREFPQSSQPRLSASLTGINSPDEALDESHLTGDVVSSLDDDKYAERVASNGRLVLYESEVGDEFTSAGNNFSREMSDRRDVIDTSDTKYRLNDTNIPSENQNKHFLPEVTSKRRDHFSGKPHIIINGAAEDLNIEEGLDGFLPIGANIDGISESQNNYDVSLTSSGAPSEDSCESFVGVNESDLLIPENCVDSESPSSPSQTGGFDYSGSLLGSSSSSHGGLDLSGSSFGSSLSDPPPKGPSPVVSGAESETEEWVHATRKAIEAVESEVQRLQTSYQQIEYTSDESQVSPQESKCQDEFLLNSTKTNSGYLLHAGMLPEHSRLRHMWRSQSSSVSSLSSDTAGYSENDSEDSLSVLESDPDLDRQGQGDYRNGGFNNTLVEQGKLNSSEESGDFKRYYHVFREGELSELIEKHVECLHIIDAYYDHANWCVVAEKVNVWKVV